jgi:tripartite-type tricarboxylate transporter receptor subunit TctC
MRNGLALAAACAVAIGAGIPWDHAQAQDAAANYPAFPVKIVVPYPAGSIPDTLGRMIGDQLQTQLGKPVVIENRAGASTLLGAKVVASAEPDGYTLLIPTVTTFSIAPQLNSKTGVDPINDFTPIARLGGTNFFLVVKSSFPAKTMREWIDEVKKNPGKYRYASAGIGTPHHIFMELLKQQFGLDITHVPYKGSVEAMPDLLAGRVDMAFLDGSQAVSHIKSGELQALGTSMAKQTDLIEGVPPIAATVPGFDWSGWIMLAGPHGMPKAVVNRIATQVADLQATPRFAGALHNALMEAMPILSPDETAAFVRDEYARWKPVIKLSGAVE